MTLGGKELDICEPQKQIMTAKEGNFSDFFLYFQGFISSLANPDVTPMDHVLQPFILVFNWLNKKKLIYLSVNRYLFFTSQSTIFQLCWHGISWVEPVLSRD